MGAYFFQLGERQLEIQRYDAEPLWKPLLRLSAGLVALHFQALGVPTVTD